MAANLLGRPLPPNIMTGGTNGTPSYMQPNTAMAMPSLGLEGAFSTPLDGVNYNQQLSNSLEHFMNPNSAYIQQARQRGAEVAATRGGINSSIAAGASERAALDAAVPLAQTATGMNFAVDQVRLNDWAQQQGFKRELYAMPFASSMNMLERLAQYSMEDPELYSPSVVSGMSNFFNQNMNDILRRYFGGR